MILRGRHLFRFIRFGSAAVLLLVSAFASWYEGSAILDNPWEWTYSTPFSHYFHGAVQEKSEILELDFFIYASKFQPFFPVIMVISSLYLLITIGYLFLKRKKRLFAWYLFILGGGLLLLSYFIFNSPTLGGQLFFYIWLVSGALCVVFAVKTYYNMYNRPTI